MEHRDNPKRCLPAWLLLVSTYACTGAQAGPSQNPGRTRRRLVERIFLTGTVEAKKAVTITAPRVPGGQLQIRWMAEDGAFVRKGQKVLEFANAAFAADLEDKKLSASKAQKELLKLESQTKAETAEKAFAVEQQKTEMAFLVESFSISLMGGSAGVLMGLAIAYIVAYYAGWPTLVTL